MSTKTLFQVITRAIVLVSILLQTCPPTQAQAPNVTIPAGTGHSVLLADLPPFASKSTMAALPSPLADAARQTVALQTSRAEPTPAAVGKPLPPGTIKNGLHSLYQVYLPLVTMRSVGELQDIALSPGIIDFVGG